MSGIDVSVVIVNYNTRALLADCLDSIREKAWGPRREIIVVDNASSDGSREFIRERYPEVRLVESGENLGFGRANNLGAAEARGKYLFLLNSDTLLLNDAIGLFFDYAEAHQAEALGAIGCLLQKPTHQRANSFGAFPSPGRRLMERWRLVFFLKDPERRVPEGSAFDVDFVTGADLFLSRALFLEAGGFDPRFFMNYEETDLQKRLAEGGRRNRIIPGPRIVHLEGGGGSPSMEARLREERSMYLYFAKHGKSRFGLFAFYLAFTLTGALSIPKHSVSDNVRYFRRVLAEMPRIVMRA
jgi:GT2 family glycosyltransferase